MTTMQKLFEQDKEKFLTNIQDEHHPEALVKALDSELSRILFLYNEAEESDRVKAAAYSIMQSIRSGISLLDCIRDTKVYSRQNLQNDDKTKKKSPKFFIALIAAILCICAACLVLFMSAGTLQVPVQMTAVLGVIAAGAVCLFLAGVFLNSRGITRNMQFEAEVIYDPQKIYRNVFGMLITVDQMLENTRSEETIDRRHALEEEKDKINQKELNFLCQLLEDAYTHKDTDYGRETISHIKYYLHGRHIDALDYTDEDAVWFDLLPGSGGTLRPALAMDGLLLKKGLASGGK